MIEITADLLYVIIGLIVLPGLIGIFAGFKLNSSLVSVIIFYSIASMFGVILFIAYANKLGV